MGRMRQLSSSSGSDSDRSRSKSRSSSANSRSSKSSRSRSRSSSKSKSSASSRSRSRSRSRSSSSSGSGKKGSDRSNASHSSNASNKSKKLVKASDRKASSALLSKLSDSSDSEDEDKVVQEKKKSSPEPEPVKPKKKRVAENPDHFDDGLDDDLIGDDEDRQRLEDMTEKEREEELFRRAERREELKKRFEITQKLKLQNKDKEEEGEVSDSDDDVSPGKFSRDQDGGRVKGYEVKHASKFNALSQLKAQREQKEKKEIERKEKEEKKRKKKDSSGSDNSDMERLAKKKKSKAADIYSSSSDSDGGKDERRRSSSSSSSSSSGSGSQSSGESDTERHSSKKIVKKAVHIESREEIEKIRLSRFKLDKFVHLPIFKKTVTGCFVRINIGHNPEKGPIYRVCEVIDVCETAKVYDVMKNRTNAGLKLKFGKSSRVYRASFVSNSPITDAEFEKWKQTCKDELVDLPTKSQVEEKKKAIDYAMTYRFSNTDVEKILVNKEKFSKGPKNYAVHKAKLQRELINAQNSGNQDMVREVEEKLADHERRAEVLDQQRSGSLSTVTFINDRNRKGNFERAMIGLKEEEERIKREGHAQDPFTRRKTRPILSMPKTKAENGEVMTSDLLLKLEQEKKEKLEKENIEAAKEHEEVEKEEKQEKPVKKDVPDIFNAHDFDIDIDINPSEAQISLNSMGVRPVASTNVLPLGPTKKSIKLEDYKKRKGII